MPQPSPPNRNQPTPQSAASHRPRSRHRQRTAAQLRGERSSAVPGLAPDLTNFPG